MDTFVVRFYRCGRCSPQEIAGVVEHVESGERSGFSGQQQLLDRLLKPRHGTVRQPTAATDPTAAAHSFDSPDSRCEKHADE